MVIKKDWEIYFEYGIDLNNRRIFLCGDIEEENIEKVVKGLYLMSSNREKPIEIYISTCGGDEYEMFGLYDIIRNCENEIITIGFGKVMSAGPLILASGDTRKAFVNTWFMVHESWYSVYEQKHSEHESLSKHVRDITKMWADCMAERTNIDSSHWIKICKGTDKYFDVQKAKELGIIDNIIGDE